MKKSSQILSFSEADKNNISLVGSLGKNLGEMVKAGFLIPNGFIISFQAYLSFIKENNLTHRIEHLLSTAHFERADSLMQVSEYIKKLILHGGMSEDFVKEIFFAYRKLSGLFGKANLVVRPSTTVDNFNVKGEANLLLKIKEAWSSLFEPSQMLYRHKKHLDHLQAGMAIVVQKMVNPEQSGVMFTIDPHTFDKATIVIENYKVQKYNLKIHNTTISSNNKLTDKQITGLALLGKKLEQHYYFPQVIEWAIEKGKIFIIKRQPFTGIIPQSNKITPTLDIPPTHRLKMLLKGDPAFPGIATGKVKLIKNIKEINTIMPGDILVATHTNSDYLPAMKKAAVIITDLGGRASHAAITGRQLGKPTIIGTKNATKILKHGMIVTVNGKRGEINATYGLFSIN
jgi:pyruvate,water dikinase